jgi:P27 family predicted phage terminase small subunit
LKLVAGERKDRINDREPVPADAAIEPPAWLDPSALEVWARYAPDLVATGVLTAWDVQAFAEWCDAASTVAFAAEQLATEGHIVEQDVFDRNGKPTGKRLVTNPWWYIQQRALEVTQKRAARFGLTPAERSGIAVDRGGVGGGEDPESYLG